MHITKVTLKRFKQFKDSEIGLKPGLSLVVGTNNSGKSSILQALATWQFCRTLLEIERGRQAWIVTEKHQGIGMNVNDFTPLQVPTLAHLWTNLKSQKITEQDGYTLKIGVTWLIDSGEEKFLEVGLSVANDRLFVKTTASNLVLTDLEDENHKPKPHSIPRIAYLPPFAGITDREARLTPAMRGRLIGQGLSGSVIRNVLFDLHEANKAKRAKLMEGREKIKSSDLLQLRKTDAWEILQRTMQELFGTELRVIAFNEQYHSYLKVECAKGELDGKKTFTRFKEYTFRDLMVEGSGLLQWLSVYALSLSPEFHTVLLDEPDAHLNAALQIHLVDRLDEISRANGLQILLATHSTELIRSYEHDRILGLKERKGRYLAEDTDKIGVIAGIGGVHTPRLHALMQHKRLLILEGASDERLLKLFCKSAGLEWPKELVSWFWTGKAAERRQLFLQLKHDIPGLRAISIRDRDNEDDASVDAALHDKNQKSEADFIALKWRRRHIENYLLCQPAIIRASGKTEQEVVSYFTAQALAVPVDSSGSDVAMPIRDAHAKELMLQGTGSLYAHLRVEREDIAKAMSADEVPADIKTFLNAIRLLCS